MTEAKKISTGFNSWEEANIDFITKTFGSVNKVIEIKIGDSVSWHINRQEFIEKMSEFLKQLNNDQA